MTLPGNLVCALGTTGPARKLECTSNRLVVDRATTARVVWDPSPRPPILLILGGREESRAGGGAERLRKAIWPGSPMLYPDRTSAAGPHCSNFPVSRQTLQAWRPRPASFQPPRRLLGADGVRTTAGAM